MLITKLLQTRKADAELPKEIRAALIESLFAPIASLIVGAVACSIVGAAVALRVGDLWIMLDTRKDGSSPFDCGAATSEIPGRAALDKLVGRLEAAAALPLPVRTNVVRRNEANALALPGGQVYVFRGLIAKADNVDEVAGVIAHARVNARSKH